MDSKDDEFLEFVRAARRRIGAFTWYGTLPEAFALVMGYFNGHNKAMLRDFQDWVGRRCGRPELAFVVHALNEALPERNDSSGLTLTKEEHSKAVDRLFAYLEAYLAGFSPDHPL